jgi:copper homeostasis protein
MEVCVDNVESAINAFRGGAKRIELCSDLAEGGTTPSVGIVRVVKQLVKIPVHVMIRPRAGDFHYSDQEMDVMRTDIKILKENGADGFVFGILHRDGTVDRDRCQELIDLSRPLPVTFHRAIDVTPNILQSLEIVVALGCERVLTSGGEVNALEGTPMIRKMIEQTDGRLVIMPGGGITERNLRRILDETGASEFHASARVPRDTAMSYVNSAVTLSAPGCSDLRHLRVTDRDRVRSMISIARESI